LSQIQLPACKLIEDESPDFSLDLGDKTVGLEVTKLFKNEGRKGSPNRRNEKEHDKWLNDIADKYYALSSVPLSVKILIKSSERHIRADRVASELAQRNNADILELQKFEVCTENRQHIKIHMRRLTQDFENHPEFRGYRRWTVVNNHAGWVLPLQEQDVLNKIKEKTRRLPEYKKKFNKNILLIVIDHTVESGMFHDIPDKISVPDNDFSSIFVALYPQKIKEIWTNPFSAWGH